MEYCLCCSRPGNNPKFNSAIYSKEGNERAGDMVYQMMSNDIQRTNPVDFFDLLKKQIGV